MSNLWVNMKRSPVNDFSKDHSASYEFSTGSITGTGVYSPAIIVPAGVQGIGATLIFSSGSAKVQTTTDPLYVVKEGSPTWYDWESGAVTATTQDRVDSCITALRLYVVSGASSLVLNAK